MFEKQKNRDKYAGPNRVEFEDDVILSDYIHITSGSKTDYALEKYYFAMALSRNDPDTDPLVVWL